MGDNAEIRQPTSMQRIVAEGAVGQLRRRNGLMATLGSENGFLKLDWVEGIARLLENPTQLEAVEAEAQALWEQGIRHIIWSGMGGSVITVRVLAELGFCSGHNGEHIAIYPLDSTDPAAINAILRQIASSKQLVLSDQADSKQALLQTLLSNVMMVGVSMGMTSEEPITHLEWFTDLLERASLPLVQHLLVMTLPGSYLDQFAQQHGVPSRPLQLDHGTGTGGRMSAPTTRVFLLPAALYLTRLTKQTGSLRAMLRRAWDSYDLELASKEPTQHVFVQLAALLSDRSINGVCRLLLNFPHEWKALTQWIEQLMEESLGKGNKGLLVFEQQALQPQAPYYSTDGTLFVDIAAEYGAGASQPQQNSSYTLFQPELAKANPQDRLSAVAASFLSWQLCMALYGYLHNITFAGQPAVEDYKARARLLRNKDNPLGVLWTIPSISAGKQRLMTPQDKVASNQTPAVAFAQSLLQAHSGTHAARALEYLDLTINGDIPNGWQPILAFYKQEIGNTLCGLPVKVRRAPAAYHSTEQSEMDGAPEFVSLRVLVRDHEPILFGTYTDIFVHAQAISTWQAMVEKGRMCFLLVLNGSIDEATSELEHFFHEVHHFMIGKDYQKWQ